MSRASPTASRASILALALLWTAGTACDRTGPTDDAWWTVSEEPTLEIGRLAGEDAYLFESIQSARILPDGRIAVADAGPPAVRVYGPDGRIRTEMGGEGEGPGQLLDIKGIWLTPDGKIGVWDPGNRRLTTFTPEGELEATAPVTPGEDMAAGNLEVFFGVFPNGDVLLASLTLGGRPEGQQVRADPWTLGRFGPDGALVRTMGRVRGMRRWGLHPVPTTPVPAVAVLGDTIYVADGYEAAIEARDGAGDSVRAIALPTVERSTDDAWAELEAELRSRGDTAELERLGSGQVPTGDPFPRVAGLLTDDRGRLWVKVFDPASDALPLKRKNALWTAPGGEWRVLRPDGEVVATVRMPEDVTPVQIQGDRLLGVALGEMDVERVVVHEIRR